MEPLPQTSATQTHTRWRQTHSQLCRQKSEPCFWQIGLFAHAHMHVDNLSPYWTAAISKTDRPHGAPQGV